MRLTPRPKSLLESTVKRGIMTQELYTNNAPVLQEAFGLFLKSGKPTLELSLRYATTRWVALTIENLTQLTRMCLDDGLSGVSFDWVLNNYNVRLAPNQDFKPKEKGIYGDASPEAEHIYTDSNGEAIIPPYQDKKEVE